MIKLVGVAIVILGLMFRFNPLLVVLVAGFATGLVAGMSPMDSQHTPFSSPGARVVRVTFSATMNAE